MWDVAHAHVGDLVEAVAGGDELVAEAPLAGGERLALEQGPQGLQAALGLVRERAGEAAVRLDRGVDLGGGEVVLQLDSDRAGAADTEQGRARVGHHQVGEVGRAEVGRQPQAHGDRVAVDHDVGHEAEVGQRLVELGVPDACEGVQDLRVRDHAGLSGSEPTAAPTGCARSSGGTSMS